jgi:hypothetical protein
VDGTDFKEKLGVSQSYFCGRPPILVAAFEDTELVGGLLVDAHYHHIKRRWLLTPQLEERPQTAGGTAQLSARVSIDLA